MTPAAERRPLLPFAWARAHHLVLLSDGIVDADGSDAGWVEELMASSMHLSARELAARIVLEGSARGAPDDMSTAVIYLNRRGS